MNKEIYRKSIQLFRFITFPIWFPIVFVTLVIFESIKWAWKFCENCPKCGWECNCPAGFGTNPND